MNRADIDESNGWNAIATQLIAHRDPIIGVATVRRWAASISAGSSILDLGCGHGFPISAALAEDGFDVFGIDASPVLAAEFQRRLPRAAIRCESVETSTFYDRRFDAVLAVGLVFLLSPDSQRKLIHRVAAVLSPGGKFLFSAPTQDTSWIDILTSRPSRSLGMASYMGILRDAAFELTEEFTDEGENHYYGAIRTNTPLRAADSTARHSFR